jgi:hypothetical protein
MIPANVVGSACCMRQRRPGEAELAGAWELNIMDDHNIVKYLV